MITPLDAVKLVALKLAMPLVDPSAAALLIVIIPPPVLALAMVMAPVKLFRLVTPLAPPVPPTQLLKLSTPLPLVCKHWLDEPSAIGKVNVTLPPELEVTPLCRVRVLLLVELLKTILPLALDDVPTVMPPLPCITKLPLPVTTLPD